MCHNSEIPEEFRVPSEHTFFFKGTSKESGSLVIRQRLGDCGKAEKEGRGVRVGTLSDYWEQQPQGHLCLQLGCDCNRLDATIFRRMTHKMEEFPPDLTTAIDDAVYEELDNFLIKCWRKRTNSLPLTANELIQLKRGRIERMQQHVGNLGIPVQSGNLHKYIRVAGLFSERGYDLDSTIVPPVTEMHKWSWIQDFPKVEHIPFGKHTRPISPPDMKWNFVMSQFSAVAERNFYNIMNTDENLELKEYLPHSCGHLVGKSLNSLERGNLVNRKIDNMVAEYKRGTGKGCRREDIIISSTDCTGFDMHHLYKFVRQEGKIFRRMFPSYRSFLKAVWRDVENPHGGNDHYTWKRSGTRCSGHPWTGWLNCWAVIKHLIKSLISQTSVAREDLYVDFLSDGDDCLVFIHKDIFDVITKSMEETFSRAGHVLRFEQKVNNMFDIVWCQSKIVQVEMVSTGEPGYKFVHNPFKMIKVLNSMVNMENSRVAENYVGGILNAFSILNHDMPIYKDLPKLCPKQSTHELSPGSGLVLELNKEDPTSYRATTDTYRTFKEAWCPDGMIEVIEDEIQLAAEKTQNWVELSYLGLTKQSGRIRRPEASLASDASKSKLATKP